MTLSHILVIVLEGESLDLVRGCEERLLQAHGDTTLIVDNPDLADVGDSLHRLTLLKAGKLDLVALVVVGLWNKLTLVVGENLELDRRGILGVRGLLDDGLVEDILDDRLGVGLAKPCLGVRGNKLHNLGIQATEGLLKVVIAIKAQVNRITRPAGVLVDELTKSKGARILGI